MKGCMSLCKRWGPDKYRREKLIVYCFMWLGRRWGSYRDNN